MTPEGAVVRACLDYLAIRQIVAWRSNTVGVYDKAREVYRPNTGRNGVADILGCLPGGRFLAIECKAGRGMVAIVRPSWNTNRPSNGPDA